MSDEQQYLRGVAAAAREQADKVAALAAGMGNPPESMAEARQLRDRARRIDEIARPTEPLSTDWLGPACTPDDRPPERPSRFDLGALLLAAGIVGGFVGAGLVQLVPYVLRMLGWLP